MVIGDESLPVLLEIDVHARLNASPRLRDAVIGGRASRWRVVVAHFYEMESGRIDLVARDRGMTHEQSRSDPLRPRAPGPDRRSATA